MKTAPRPDSATVTIATAVTREPMKSTILRIGTGFFQDAASMQTPERQATRRGICVLIHHQQIAEYLRHLSSGRENSR